MLFYVKKYFWLEMLTAAVLAGAGVWGMRALHLSPYVHVDAPALLQAACGAFLLTAWTLLVQQGYALAKGRAYASELTQALARNFYAAGALQIAGAWLAAASEEIFFRGFVQGAFGIIAGAVAFMLAHIGKKEIRVVGYWSIFQGLGLGCIYAFCGNLLVPILAHGLFDMGAMIYFRFFLSREPA